MWLMVRGKSIIRPCIACPLGRIGAWGRSRYGSGPGAPGAAGSGPINRFRRTACHTPMVPIPSGSGQTKGFLERFSLPDEPPRGALPMLLVPIGLLLVASNLASLFYATLVEQHPLWLLGLSSVNRYLALVTPHTAVWSYLLVGGTRLLIADPFFYLLG